MEGGGFVCQPILAKKSENFREMTVQIGFLWYNI